MIRQRVNRLLAPVVAAALERVPSLESFVSTHVDGRRLQITLARMRKRGLQIGVVYDIGAHRGQWTNVVRPALSGARFFLFEANDTHRQALEQIGEPYFIAALSAERRLVDFYANGGPGDSYFREATHHYAGVEPRRVETTTLDDLIRAHNLPYPDFIKADVQGAELDVLAGGANAVEHAKLVLLECPVVEYNAGAPDMSEYFRFMNAAGFTPLDLVGAIWHTGRMIHLDVLFARVGAYEGLPR